MKGLLHKNGTVDIFEVKNTVLQFSRFLVSRYVLHTPISTTFKHFEKKL